MTFISPAVSISARSRRDLSSSTAALSYGGSFGCSWFGFRAHSSGGLGERYLLLCTLLLLWTLLLLCVLLLLWALLVFWTLLFLWMLLF